MHLNYSVTGSIGCGTCETRIVHQGEITRHGVSKLSLLILLRSRVVEMIGKSISFGDYTKPYSSFTDVFIVCYVIKAKKANGFNSGIVISIIPIRYNVD